MEVYRGRLSRVSLTTQFAHQELQKDQRQHTHSHSHANEHVDTGPQSFPEVKLLQRVARVLIVHAVKVQVCELIDCQGLEGVAEGLLRRYGAVRNPLPSYGDGVLVGEEPTE